LGYFLPHTLERNLGLVERSGWALGRFLTQFGNQIEEPLAIGWSHVPDDGCELFNTDGQN